MSIVYNSWITNSLLQIEKQNEEIITYSTSISLITNYKRNESHEGKEEGTYNIERERGRYNKVGDLMSYTD